MSVARFLLLLMLAVMLISAPVKAFAQLEPPPPYKPAAADPPPDDPGDGKDDDGKQNCEVKTISKPAVPTTKFEIGQCASSFSGKTYQSWEFTSKLVDCVEGTIAQTVLNVMNVFKTEFAWLVGALSTMVITFFGVRVAMGERDLKKRTAILAIKLAAVAMFISNLPELIGWVFTMFQQLLILVGGGSPWERIDDFFGKLIGVGETITLVNGLLGVIAASLFSSKVGIAVFFAGVLALVNTLIFILSLIYTYLLAFLTIGFLLAMSPVIIPLTLFFYTERYLEKWSHIIVSCILTPVLLFAFVNMFIGIFTNIIGDIFTILGGNDFSAHWRLNTSLYSWVMPSDPSMNMMMEDIPAQAGCGNQGLRPPVQSNVNPFLQNSFNNSLGKMATLDFGVRDVEIMQSLTFAFVKLWIFASLMKSMVQLIPFIASSIATVSSHISFGGNSSLVGRLQQGSDNLKANIQKGFSNGGAEYASKIGSMLGNRDKK